MNHSWEHTRTQVRQFRAHLQTIYPVQVLAITKDFAIHDNVLYFLSNNRDASDWCPTRHMQIYQSRLLDQCETRPVQLDDDTAQQHYLTAISTLPVMERSLLYSDYMALVDHDGLQDNTNTTSTLYRQLQLPGVSTFDIKDDTIMFTFHHDVYIGKLGKIPKLIPHKSASIAAGAAAAAEAKHTNNNNTASPPTSSTAYSPLLNHMDMDTSNKQTSYTSNQEPTTDQPHRSDPKLGGFFNDRIAFIRNRDIWVTDWNGNDAQLTFCSTDASDPTLKCGVAEYMMQEEFHRFTGYYWSPPITTTQQRTERILYLETSEAQVEQVFISKSSSSTSSSSSSSRSTPPSMADTASASSAPAADSIRYPRAGKPNATSTIKIVEFEIGDTSTSPVNIRHKQLWGKHDIRALFPWMEYIVRFGWLPDGQSVWLQLLSRDQQTSAVIKVHLDQFSVKDKNQNDSIQTEILWHETSTAWINVTDVYYFMQSSDTATVTKLIWSSERVNGFRHLFLVEKSVDQPEAQVTQLTDGQWCCVNRPLYVDEARSLVYFSARMHTPLESHFYVTSYSNSHHHHHPTLLTKLGFSHTVTMDSPDYFIDCFSSIHDPQVTVVQKLSHTKANPVALDGISLLIPVSLKSDCETPPSPPASATHFVASFSHECRRLITDPLTRDLEHSRDNKMSKYKDSVEPNGEIFSFTTSDGETLFGCLYKPNNYEPGKSYPTLLHIYGGPTTQLVANEFKFPRLMRYLMAAYFGFAVVIIDSRGSSDRGLVFESHIQHRLGTVELKDQLEGLQFVQDTKFGALPAKQQEDKLVSVVDLNRLAITGWSYGGYLSLMALAQYPDRFKMSIAGAPVTQWELYDAAYTERYMGLPEENHQAYHDSNVLTYVDRFPDNENRLLIAHGLIDENVHFRNTELLVTQLVKLKKPHYLQVYPSEKHGLRHASVNEHFETLMFYWLSNYL